MVLTGHSGLVTGAVFSHDGTLAITCSTDRTIRFHQTSNGLVTCRLLGQKNESAIVQEALSFSGYFLLIFRDDGTAEIFNLRTIEYTPQQLFTEAVSSAQNNGWALTEEERETYLTGRTVPFSSLPP
jgi:WD40 repeat protein